MAQQAFVLRISPDGKDRVPEALEDDQIIIGWAAAEGLLDPDHSWESLRSIVSEAFYSSESTFKKAGRTTGELWRFIRDMKKGDLVVVPHGSNFYVAEIAGPAIFITEKQAEGTAYRRNVTWLNNKSPIPRSYAHAPLISRMKIYGTCASATDLLGQVNDCLERAKSGDKPTFHTDLKDRLVQETLVELRTGRLDSYGFENLISAVLEKLGASQTNVIPRIKDKGDDVVAIFPVAGEFQQTLVVQAKHHYQPEPPTGKNAVDELISGIESHSADLGMVVTAGTISDEAHAAAKAYFDDKGIKIQLVDGEQFAKRMVELGVDGY